MIKSGILGGMHQQGRHARRRLVVNRDGDTCIWCGRRLTDLVAATVDHVVPRVKGGPSWLENEVAACRRCNGLKADKPILAYLMAHRPRAASLLFYGRHLSPMLVDLARNMADPEDLARVERLADPDYPYRD